MVIKHSKFHEVKTIEKGFEIYNMVGDNFQINCAHVKAVWPPPHWLWHKTKAKVYATILLHIILLMVKRGESSIVAIRRQRRGYNI